MTTLARFAPCGTRTEMVYTVPLGSMVQLFPANVISPLTLHWPTGVSRAAGSARGSPVQSASIPRVCKPVRVPGIRCYFSSKRPGKVQEPGANGHLAQEWGA